LFGTYTKKSTRFTGIRRSSLSKQFTSDKPEPFEVTEPSISEKGAKEQMPNAKQLTKRQLVVIEDLFSGELDEQAVLDKYKISRNLYNKWQSDDNFAEQFDRRIAGAYRQSVALIARYAPLAAAKLIQLTESDKAETARKACLDIISMPILTSNRKTHPSSDEPSLAGTQPQSAETQQLTEQTAGRLLAVLAEEKDY
jgi:hypothetical protein